MENTLGLNPSDASLTSSTLVPRTKSSGESLVGSSPIPGTNIHGKRVTCIIIDDLQESEMSIPIPPQSPDYEFKSLPSKPTSDKPNLKDFDDDCNWKQSPTNPDVQINIITGKMRTRDMHIPNGPKTGGNP